MPPSYSIISDYFPADRRGTALGLFNLGPPIGQALGVAFGAKIAAVYDWRLAFVVVGVVGLVAAVAVWSTIREPKRGATDDCRRWPLPDEAVSFWSTLRMFAIRPTLTLVSLAAGATQFVTYATMGFTTLFLMREKAMTLDEIALWYALVLGVCVSAGIFLSGRLIDRFATTLAAGVRDASWDCARDCRAILHRFCLHAERGRSHWRFSRCRHSSTTSISRLR